MHRQVVSELLGGRSLLDKDRRGANTSNAPTTKGSRAARNAYRRTSRAAATNSLIAALREAAAARGEPAPKKSPGSAAARCSEIHGQTKRLGLKELALLSDKPLKGLGEFVGHKPDVYSFQAVVADVEWMEESGEVRLKHLYFVYDVGTVINPLITKGRSRRHCSGTGVRAHRRAQARRRAHYDGDVGDYKLPNIADNVPLTTVARSSQSRPRSFGAKSVAEAGISIVAPAVATRFTTQRE